MQIDRIVSGELGNNTYFVSNDENECIIVDASCSLEEAKEMTKGLKVLAILLTHGHYDHFLNLDYFVDFFKVKCYMCETEFEKLFDANKNYSTVFKTIFSSSLKEDAFVFIKEKEETINLGSFEVKSYLTRGHTNGCLCFKINNEALFTGDTRFGHSYGRTDLYTGNIEDMKRSLAFINKNFKGIKFYAGHGNGGVV